MAIENAYNRGLARAREARIRQDADAGSAAGSYVSGGLTESLKGDDQALWVKEPPFSTDRILLERKFFGVNTSVENRPIAPNTYYSFPRIDVSNVRYLFLSFVCTPKPSTSQYSYTVGFWDNSSIPAVGEAALGTPSDQLISVYPVRSYPILGMTEYRTPVLTQAPFRNLIYYQRFDVAGQQTATVRMADLVPSAGDPDAGVVWIYYAFGN